MTLMNPMARWGAAWLVSCGLLTGCTDEVKFEQVSAQKQALETNVYLNSENLILKLAPTDEEWLADPVDEANVIKNFKANLLRGQRGKQLRIQGEWAEYQLDNGVTGWSRISLWEPDNIWFPGANAVATKLCLDLSCNESEELSPLTLMLVNSKAVNGLNPVRFESRVGFVPSEVLELDDESVFFAFQVVRAEWSRDNRNLENNGRILDKARIKYPDSKYLDILGELIPFADFARVPHVDTSDLEALDLVKRRAAESVSNK